MYFWYVTVFERGKASSSQYFKFAFAFDFKNSFFLIKRMRCVATAMRVASYDISVSTYVHTTFMYMLSLLIGKTFVTCITFTLYPAFHLQHILYLQIISSMLLPEKIYQSCYVVTFEQFALI